MLRLAGLLVLLPAVAVAQLVPNGGIIPGQNWSANQWNSAWSSKMDGVAGVCNGCSLLNPTITAGVWNNPNLVNPTIGALASLSVTGSSSFTGAVSGSGITTLLAPYALLASPTFTGTARGAALNFTGNGTIGGTLSVTGASTLVGQAFIGNGNVVNFPTSPNYSGTAPLFVKATLAGTQNISGANPLAVIWVPTDSAQTSSGNISGLLVNMSMTTGSSGFRNGVNVSMNAQQSGITAADLLPFVGTGTIQVNVGGTGTTQNTSSGIAWGANFVAQALGTATNLSGVAGMELDVTMAAATSAHHKLGLSITKLANDGARGVLDEAMNISDVPGASTTWKAGLQFGIEDAQWSFGTDSTLIGTKYGANYGTNPNVAAYGLDLLKVAFSNYAIRLPGFSVDPTGIAQIGTGLIAPISTGMSIDASGTVMTAAAVSAGGTGYVLNDLLFFSNGGVAQVTGTSGGAITSISILTYPTLPGSASIPSNPVATATWTRGLGSGAALNLTWDASRTTLSLQPSGGPTIVGGTFRVTGASPATSGKSIFSITNSTAPASTNELAYQINDKATYAIPTFGGTVRPRIFETDLSVPTGVTSSTIHENFWSSNYLTGAGTSAQEINQFHAYFENNMSGSITGPVEGYEASALNNGTMIGYVDYLGLFHNAASATTSAVFGIKAQLINDNTTASAVGTYSVLDCEAMAGSGSHPTSEYCIRNGNPSGAISTLGNVNIGSVGVSLVPLQLVGADQSAATVLVKAVDSASVSIFEIHNDGGLRTKGAAGVTCTGSPTSSFASVNGIVTHC